MTDERIKKVPQLLSGSPKLVLKFCACLLMACCLILFNGCSKEEREKAPEVEVPKKIQHTLTYSAGDNGSIEGATSQIVDHGGSGTQVTAAPAENFHFLGWSDGIGSPDRTDSGVNADIAVTASFAINQCSLVYAAEENGSIEGSMSQKVDYGGAGSLVTAVPDAGYHFVSWSDGDTSAARTDSDLTSDLTVSASFALNQYTLVYAAGENGSIGGNIKQTVDHGGDGSQVIAVPVENYHFVSWSDGTTSPSRTDRKVTADTRVSASFAINQYRLTYTVGENGSLSGSGSQNVDHGSDGTTVTAVPADGYHFVTWSDGATDTSRTDRKVTSDLSVKANFALNQYNLTYTARQNGTIEGVSLQQIGHGDTGKSVTAVAEEGYHFVTWSDGVTTAQRTDLNVAGDLAVSALFEINSYVIGGSVEGLAQGTQLMLQNNAGGDLLITTNGDFFFAAEGHNASPYEVTVLTQPTSPNQVCSVANPTGTVSGENVTNISVTCVPLTYTINGNVSGLLDGDQAVLRVNDHDNLVLSNNGPFTFGKALDDGSGYEVKVFSYPERPNWTCTVDNAMGTLAGFDVTDVIVDCYPEVILKTVAGVRKVMLNWNSQDFNKVTFNLCRAQENISNDEFSSCLELKDGVLVAEVSSTHVISGLTNDIPYWFQIEARYATGRRTLSEIVMAIPFAGLNDSGIDWCADNTANVNSHGTRTIKDATCNDLTTLFPGQDAVLGRDASARIRKLDKIGSGSAGFDFTKLCRSGEAAGEKKCPPNPKSGTGFDTWACTRDNMTGLTWEIKTDNGLRDRNNTYTWYIPDSAVNGGAPGLQNGGNCTDSGCDTQAYVQAINDLNLCGVSDWRLPTKRELLSIVDNGRLKPAIDVRFFPNTLPAYYWSHTPSSDQENKAWQVYFLYGEASPGSKEQKSHIRLVRGRTVTFGLDNP